MHTKLALFCLTLRPGSLNKEKKSVGRNENRSKVIIVHCSAPSYDAQTHVRICVQ